MTPDPFGTAALRAGVLTAWRGSPTRFREDANAEADLVRGGYADRLLVELAQNAADAAQRAGTPGHLRLVLQRRELRAANTGAPLDADGVAALAALRASAKRDTAAVGRFGVGFAAVLAVTDAPSVVSTTGGVAFSAARTVAEVDGDAPLRAELARRDGRPPVLRLAWPVDGAPPAGFATEVRLPLRAGVDGPALLAAAAEEAPDLLLALPWLARVDVGDRTWTRTGDDPVRIEDRAWRVVRRAGTLPPHLVGGPEDPAGWTVTWALPVDADGAPRPLGADVLHAPTRTAERLTLPARLTAGVPVEPDRRRVAVGPAARAVLAEAAAAYPALAAAVAPADCTALVPAAGFPASEIDGLLRDGVLAALRDAAWLPGVAGPVAPARAQVLDAPLPDLAQLLADVVPGLLTAELAGPRHAAPLAALGVPRLRPAALGDLLTGLQRPPGWWRRCYAALAPLLDADPAARDELGALPVPLADGRTVTGPRGTLLSSEDLPVGELRLVHPDAAHPLLERLGARPAGPDELLDALRPAVERSVADADDGADVAPLAAAVLALAPRAAPRAWLGALALPDTDGEPRRADELVLPDGALRPLLVPDAPLGVCASRAPREALRAVGVLDGFAVLDEPDPAGPDHDLDDEERWWAAVDGDARPPDRLLAVRDLDLVDDAAWPAALRLLAADPSTAAAVRRARGYTGWWLARHARLGGHPPRHWRLPSAPLGGLYDPVALDGVADDLLAAAGVRADLAVDGAADAADLLARLADAGRAVTAAVTWRAHAALAAADLDPADLAPPERVRAVTGEVVDAEDAVVLDRPELAAVVPAARSVAGGDPVALADLLDLPLAAERVRAAVVDPGGGRQVAWADLPEVVAACAALGRAVPDGAVVLHDHLRVRTADGEVAVPWWPAPDGTVHAADLLRALVGVVSA